MTYIVRFSLVSEAWRYAFNVNEKNIYEKCYGLFIWFIYFTKRGFIYYWFVGLGVLLFSG